jgi:hypothetical protein
MSPLARDDAVRVVAGRDEVADSFPNGSPLQCPRDHEDGADNPGCSGEERSTPDVQKNARGSHRDGEDGDERLECEEVLAREGASQSVASSKKTPSAARVSVAVNPAERATCLKKDVIVRSRR